MEKHRTDRIQVTLSELSELKTPLSSKILIILSPVEIKITVVGNPITFPFIWLTIYRIGIVFIEKKEKDKIVELNFDSVLNGGWEILFPMLIGSAILCLPVWFISYFMIRFLLTSFKRRNK